MRNRMRGWQVALAGMSGLAAAVGIGRFAFTPILPMMQEDVSLSLSQGGWLAAANYLGYFIGAMWAMVQRTRTSSAVRLALVAIALSTMAMAWADSLLSWLLLRTVAGIASAWAFVHITSWCVGQLAAIDKRGLGGVVFAGVGVGIAIAGALCFSLMADSATSRKAWLMLGGVGFVVVAITWPILGTHEAGAPTQKPNRRDLRLNASAIRLVICYGATGLGYIIPATYLPTMAKQVIHDPAVFGWAWPIFGLAAAASTLLAAPLVRAFGNRRVWMFGALVMAIGVASPVVVPGIAGIIIAAVLVGGTFLVTTMTGVQEAREIGGPFASTLVAAFTASFAAGQILGPILANALVARFDSIVPALLAVVGILIASAVVLMATKSVKAY